MKRVTILITLFLAAFSLFAQEYIPENIVSAEIVDNQIVVTYNIPAGMHQSLQEDLFFVEVEPAEGITFEPTVYPEGSKTGDGYIEYHGKVQLTKMFYVSPEFAGKPELIVYAGFQICLDTGSCMMPEEFEYKLSFTLGNTPSQPAEQQAQSGMLKFLIMAFLGGLILNVMPCVLPVLSIKAMSLVKQSQQNKSQIFRSSMAYTLGILVSFIILALVIVILKATGESVGWGFQFQNTGFVMALLIMIFIFSLSMFDVFIIRAPGMGMATKASSKGGYSGSFFSGIFAVLLATPCTAPLLAPALGFAFSQPPVMIFIFFILIGLGLAFPFILLGVWPKAIKAIPRPGEWMNIFKEVMGFLLLLTGWYLLRSLYFLIGGDNLLKVIFYLIVLGFAAWLYGRFARPEFSRRKQWTYAIIALIIAIGSGFLTLHFKQTDMTASGTAHYPREWQKFEPELVEKYVNENKPVFVDFGAEWCLTCKTNEEAVLFTDDIESAFKEHGVIMLRGDNTKKDVVISEWLSKFKRAGVPLYLFYLPGETEPVVLPELITKDMIYNLLDKLDKE